MAETKKTTAKKNSSVGTNVPISDILYRTLHYWPWVLLSLFVCVGGGVIYLLCTPNVYTTTASMLIKDESAGNSMNNSDFADFGLFQSNTNIQNEITTLKSPDLMEEVVKRLNLDMNYYKPGRFHREVAYGSNLPVEVTIVDYPNNGNATFNLDVSAKGDVEISSLKVWDKSKGNETYKGHLNDTIQTAVGKMVVTPTTAYKKGEPVELKVEKQPVNMMAIFYEGQLTVTMSNENSTIINLVILDESTQRAQEILSTLIGVYNEQWIRDKNQIAVSTSNFINDRLGVIEGELGHVDSDISSYKSQHLIPDVQAASSMYMEQNQRISQDILALNNQLQMTRYIRSYLTAEGNRDQVLPTNTGVENSNIQSQISEYNQLILQRNSLLSKSSDKNPLVMALDDQLAALRSAIIGSVDNSIIALNTEIKNLQGSQASTTSKIASNPTQAKYLLSVERQQKVKESLYLFLLQKREENELSQAFTAYNTRIVQRPSSYGPTAPNKNKVLMGCFLLGLAIPFCVVYLIETNNTRLRGRKDVEGLSLPFLGEIPQNGSKDSKDGDEDKIVVSPESRNIINEAFRVVRTNMEFMNSTHDRANVIVMTSFNPGSGKSFLTMNLGAALAIKKKRVVVIDGDMRHGSTSAYLGSPNVGLSDYLSGAVNNLDELLVPVPGYDNFHVIPIGKVPPNPTELLESPRFAALINDLKSHCDYIMVDCPPIEVVADTQIIDKSVDRTIFVIRAGLLDRSMLPKLDKLYEEKKYRNMAFILNGTRNDQGRYGYSHSYRYGYGYGYGYGYNYGEGKSKKKKK